ncbi:MAG: glycosyltransferase family 4 protein [Candidatus Omnitrophica bacterium]|nr:glycosyltransferase family 4 protein [Candidatus Omnitrophota bacterium]
MKHNKLTIVFIARVSIDENMGGSVKYFTDLAESFVKLGCNVHILVGTLNDFGPEEYVEKGVVIHKVKLFMRNSFLNYVYRNWKYRCVLRQLNNRTRVDLINIQEAGFLIFVKKDRVLGKIPCVYTFHASCQYEVLYDYEKLKTTYRGVNRLLRYIKFKAQHYKFRIAENQDLRYAKRVIVMSDYVKSQISTFYGDEYLVKVKKFPIGVFDEYFLNDSSSQIQAKTDKNLLIFFTLRRLEPRMGLWNLLSAIKIVIKKMPALNLQFIIGGKGPLEVELKERAKELFIENHVSFTGYLSEKEKLRCLSVADAFVIPTEDLEGFGIVIIEALANNLPIIATNAGAIPEIINSICPELLANGVSGNDIADKIEYFIKNIDSYRNNTKYREYAYHNFRWAKISKDLLGEFENICYENTLDK